MKTIQVKDLIPIIADSQPLQIVLNQIGKKERYTLNKPMIMARIDFYGDFYIKALGVYVINGCNTLWLEISTEPFKE